MGLIGGIYRIVNDILKCKYEGGEKVKVRME